MKKWLYNCRINDAGEIVSEYFFPYDYDYECFKDLARKYEGKVVKVGAVFHDATVWYAEIDDES